MIFLLSFDLGPPHPSLTSTDQVLKVKVARYPLSIFPISMMYVSPLASSDCRLLELAETLDFSPTMSSSESFITILILRSFLNERAFMANGVSRKTCTL